MEAINGKTDGAGGVAGSLPADEWNQLPTEVQNVITQLGQALSNGDLNQLGKSIAGYVANGDFYTDGGAANAYVLTKIGTKQTAPAYTDGFKIRFIPANTNTTASTVNVAGLGVKTITADDGSTLNAGNITAGETIHCEFDAGADKFRLIPQLTTSQVVNLKSGRINLIINGNFAVNQRVVSGSVVLAAGIYGHDRFKAGAGGCSYTFATSGSGTITTLTITAGTLIQEVEGVNIDSGAHVLSWLGTSQGQIDGGGFGDTGEVTKVLVAGTTIPVEFNTGTLSKVQLERSTVSTEFERRSISEEEHLSYRYYFTMSVAVAWLRRNDDTVRSYTIPRRVPMRVNPSESASVNTGALSFAGSDAEIILIAVSGAAAGSDANITDYTADAEI